MANDNSDYLKNGKRTTLSTNSDMTELDDLIQENAEKIRVGKDYQAQIPKLLVLPTHRRERINKKALLVWAPTENISESKLNEYILLSKEKYGYNSEQALGMLFWHHHDIEKALSDLANFAPNAEEWSTAEKATFESAFNNNGKNFLRIKQVLPAKAISALVSYYYLWKNKRKKTSVIDRQAKKLANVRSSENQNGSREGSSSAESEPDDKKDAGEGSSKLSCSVCGVFVSMIQPTSKGPMCGTCYAHFKRTNGGIRPTLGPPRPNNRHLNVARNKRSPPGGMYVNHDDLQIIASDPEGHEGSILSTMDDEIQSNKQDIARSHKKLKLDINEFRNNQTTSIRVTPRWTNDEVLLAIQGMRDYGRDFKAIAELLGTKNPTHLHSFYTHYCKRYQLDKILEDHDAKQKNPIIELSDDDDEQVSGKHSPSSSISKLNTPSSMASGSRLVNNFPLSKSKAHQTVAAAK